MEPPFWDRKRTLIPLPQTSMTRDVYICMRGFDGLFPVAGRKNDVDAGFASARFRACLWGSRQEEKLLFRVQGPGLAQATIALTVSMTDP